MLYGAVVVTLWTCYGSLYCRIIIIIIIIIKALVMENFYILHN